MPTLNVGGLCFFTLRWRVIPIRWVVAVFVGAESGSKHLQEDPHQTSVTLDLTFMERCLLYGCWCCLDSKKSGSLLLHDPPNAGTQDWRNLKDGGSSELPFPSEGSLLFFASWSQSIAFVSAFTSVSTYVMEGERPPGSAKLKKCLLVIPIHIDICPYFSVLVY